MRKQLMLVCVFIVLCTLLGLSQDPNPGRHYYSGTSSVRVGSGDIGIATNEIASGACATTQTATVTGANNSDTLSLNFNADPTAVTGYTPSANGMLTIIGWLTVNTVNIAVCNNTAGAITPGSVTLHYAVFD